MPLQIQRHWRKLLWRNWSRSRWRLHLATSEYHCRIHCGIGGWGLSGLGGLELVTYVKIWRKKLLCKTNFMWILQGLSWDMPEAHRLDPHKWCWVLTVTKNFWVIFEIYLFPKYLPCHAINCHNHRVAAMDGFKEMAEVSPAVFAEICTPKYVIGQYMYTSQIFKLVGIFALLKYF